MAHSALRNVHYATCSARQNNWEETQMYALPVYRPRRFNKMRLLYIPCGHPLQEADDCLMWDRLGIEWFSTGYYWNTDRPGDLPCITRPTLGENDKEIRRQFADIYQKATTIHSDKSKNQIGKKNKDYTGTTVKNVWELTPDFVSNFDAVLVAHFAKTVLSNWHSFNGASVMLKTFGMHDIHDECLIQNIRRYGAVSIRNSPTEHIRNPSAFGGMDACIRGSVVRDEHEISGWTGENKSVVMFSNNYNTTVGTNSRLQNVNKLCSRISYPVNIYGAASQQRLSQGSPFIHGFASHKQKIEMLQKSRVCLISGTPGANNTYSFVEAWIMGIPVVCFGPRLWGSTSCEIPELVENGVDGFYADTIPQLADCINMLMEDHDLAKRVGEAGRKKAISIYGRDVLAQQWRSLFEKQGLVL